MHRARPRTGALRQKSFVYNSEEARFDAPLSYGVCDGLDLQTILDIHGGCEL